MFVLALDFFTVLPLCEFSIRFPPSLHSLSVVKARPSAAPPAASPLPAAVRLWKTLAFPLVFHSPSRAGCPAPAGKGTRLEASLPREEAGRASKRRQSRNLDFTVSRLSISPLAKLPKHLRRFRKRANSGRHRAGRQTGQGRRNNRCQERISPNGRRRQGRSGHSCRRGFSDGVPFRRLHARPPRRFRSAA